jgi:flagellar motor switch protein FliN/FliY
MERFYDVNVNVWAELGRITLPIGELLQLSEGTVLPLRRPVSEPVDLVAQGIRLARGEVVVVDDCFAVRIKEIDHSSKRSG